MSFDTPENYLVSVIIPVHNAEKWLDEALNSIHKQTWKESLELSIYNDACNDGSLEIINKWKPVFENDGIGIVLGHNDTGLARGVGFAKNSAIKQSHGKYLCFFDADDIMFPRRIELQLHAALKLPSNVLDVYFKELRMILPNDTLNGTTACQKNNFIIREIFDAVGYFDEIGKGHPEDLVFYYKHLNNQGKLFRVNETLLLYRYHETAASFSVHENTIWEIRMKYLEEKVLKNWDQFTIWNAGKQGRRFYRSLSRENRTKVLALCDVDTKKIAKGEYRCEMLKDGEDVPVIPIIHFKDAVRPFIICVKLNLTNGDFERNLSSLNLKEGTDYVLFS